MKKNKKKIEHSEIAFPEKHPLEPLPDEPVDTPLSEEELDKIPDEDQEESLLYEEPAPGEGP